MENQRAVLDMVNRQLYLCGPGAIQFVPPPGTLKIPLIKSQSGHLMMPISHFREAVRDVNLRARRRLALNFEQIPPPGNPTIDATTQTTRSQAPMGCRPRSDIGRAESGAAPDHAGVLAPMQHTQQRAPLPRPPPRLAPDRPMGRPAPDAIPRDEMLRRRLNRGDYTTSQADVETRRPGSDRPDQ